MWESIDQHKLLIGMAIIGAAVIVDCSLLFLVIEIDWKQLPGPEAGIVSSIMTGVGGAATSRAGSVIGYFFSSSPKLEA